jgi:electron transfer flavoprotein-quinone oxidoreductase
MKDLHKYRRMPQVLHRSRQFFDGYPQLVGRAMRGIFTVDGTDKRTREREIVADFRRERGLGGMLRDAFNVWRAVR